MLLGILKILILRPTAVCMYYGLDVIFLLKKVDVKESLRFNNCCFVFK